MWRFVSTVSLVDVCCENTDEMELVRCGKQTKAWQDLNELHETEATIYTASVKIRIVPVRMPDETAAFEFAHRCKERGVFVVPVVFPVKGV